MATREIYQITDRGRVYSGYAKFGADGSYQGSRGGYNSSGKRPAPNSGGGGYRYNKNGASAMQNVISTAGARQAARTASVYRNNATTTRAPRRRISQQRTSQDLLRPYARYAGNNARRLSSSRSSRR